MKTRSIHFEHKTMPLASRRVFYRRVLVFTIFSMALLTFSLGIGITGYIFFADLGFVDAFLNASMILTGMGPIDKMPSPASKIFAALYALFSGVAFLSAVSVLMAPVAHRFFHALHVEE